MPTEIHRSKSKNVWSTRNPFYQGKKRPGPRRRLQMERLEDRRLLAIVNWDGGGDGTNWADPLNWDTDSVPTLADDVIINVAGSPLVRIVNSSQAVNSVMSSEALEIFGAADFPRIRG